MQIEIKEKELKVPKKWGLKNPQVNQLMQQKAKSLLKNLNKVHPLYKKGQKNYTDVLFCFEKYIKSFKKSTEENKMLASCDRSNMEKIVSSFVADVSSHYNIDFFICKNIWENIR